MYCMLWTVQNELCIHPASHLNTTALREMHVSQSPGLQSCCSWRSSPGHVAVSIRDHRAAWPNKPSVKSKLLRAIHLPCLLANCVVQAGDTWGHAWWNIFGVWSDSATWGSFAQADITEHQLSVCSCGLCFAHGEWMLWWSFKACKHHGQTTFSWLANSLMAIQRCHLSANRAKALRG